MPKGRPNSYAGGGFIQSMREKHEPHMKLAGKVEGLEKNIPIELAQLHKTLSKSFGMQRKTLMRVLGLEKRLAELEAEKAQREIEQEEVIEDELDGEIPEGLDDVLDDIREEEVGGDEESGAPRVATKTKKKRPILKVKKKKISGSAFKKGTPFDDGFKARVLGEDDKGEYLSKEERIRRFKGGSLAKPDDLKPGDAETPAAETSAAEVDTEKSQEGLLPILKSISSSVNGIKETLIGQAEISKEQTDFLRRQQENKKRDKKESGLEKMMGGVKKVASTALKPVMSIWEKIVNFLTNVLFGKVVMDLFSWFSNPANKDKVTSIFRFIKDWWPLLVAGIMAFVGPGVTFVVGAIALLTWGIPKIVDAVKSIFGFGSKIDKELEKGESDALKDSEDLESGMDSELKAQLDDKQKNTEQPQELKQTEQAAEDTKKETEALGMNKGGEVPGTGNKDTVPAMLTPGEFVMSKGAVEQYGVDTLEGLNAAAGGTNIPTLQKTDKKFKKGGMVTGYNDGGFANITNTMTSSSSDSDGNFSVGKRYVAPEEAKERIAEMGMPSMNLMDGTVVPDFGKMGGEKVTQGLQLTRDIMVENGASPERIAQLDEVMAMPDAQPESIALMINQLVPGSMENTMMNVGDSISMSAKKTSGYKGGGLVQGYKGGGLVQGFQGGGQVRQMGRGASKKRMEIKKGINKPNVKSIKTPVKKSSVVAYNEQAQAAGGGGGYQSKSGGNNDVPNFNAAAKRSLAKIKTLGISV